MGGAVASPFSSSCLRSLDTREDVLQSLVDEATAEPHQPGSPPLPVLFLEGGAGLGKTYLTRQLVERCAARDVPMFMSVADSMEIKTPYFAITPLLQAVVNERSAMRKAPAQPSLTAERGTSAVMDPAPLYSSLLSLLPESDVKYARLLLSFLPDCSPIAVTEQLLSEGEVEEDVRPALIQRMMLSVLRSYLLLRPTTLLVVEDAHWMDLHSWKLVKEIADSLPAVRLLLTCRPLTTARDSTTPLTPSSLSTMLDYYRAIKRHPRCRDFLLTGMDQRASAAMCASILGCSGLSSFLSATIHQRSDGIPLFTRHLCLYMKEKQLIRLDPLTSIAALVDSVDSALVDASLPSSLEALLASVLDRLDADTQLALRVASVVGRRFACSLLAELSPNQATASQVQDMMTEAADQHVVAPCPALLFDSGSDDTWYSFCHQLLRDAAYSSLLYHQRRQLHARIGDHLAAQCVRNSPNSGSAVFGSCNHRAGTSATASSQLLASHYWLSLCNANDVLVDEPDQRLLDCAVDWLLRAAQSSISLSALENGTLFLGRAVRCIHKLANVERREQWELRWLNLVVGTVIAVSGPQIVALALDAGISQPTELVNFALVARCLRTFGNRALALLSSPRATDGLTVQRMQDVRFYAVTAKFFACFEDLPQLRAAASELKHFARTATGDDTYYYQLESFRCLSAAFFRLSDSDGIIEQYTLLDSHDGYRAVLAGEKKLTRWALGHHPIPRLVVGQAGYKRLCGHVRSCMQHVDAMMPVMFATQHPSSILLGWAEMANVALRHNCSAVSRRLAAQAIAALPAEDSKATRLMFIMRQWSELMLRVWDYHDSLVSSPSWNCFEPPPSSLQWPFEAEMLSLIAALDGQGDALGIMLHLIVQTLPLMLLYRLELPLSVHEAMVAVCRKFARAFACAFGDIEKRCLEAEMHIKLLWQSRAAPRDEAWQQHVAEAERLLTEAQQLVTFERLEDLRLAMVRAELQAALGVRPSADELLAALAGVPEADGCDVFEVLRARRMIQQLTLRLSQRPEI